MIRISKETDYGIILLAQFVLTGTQLRRSAREVALATQLPLPMVSKILKILTQKGLLSSQRGPKGGYRLIRRASSISIAEVIHVVEGPIAMTECVEGAGKCNHEPMCHFHDPWRKINRTVVEVLGRISLVDMMASPEVLVPLEGLEHSQRN